MKKIISKCWLLLLISVPLTYASGKTYQQQLMLSGKLPHFTSTHFKQIASLKNNKSQISHEDDDCRAHIREVLCLVDPPAEVDNNKQKRTCLDGGESYAHHFEVIYDNYPVVLQKMFCSLDVIYIEKKFIGTAYAGVIEDDEGNIIGAKMGIRQSVLDEKLDLNLWASWKEQLSFGGIANSYTLTAGLPSITTSTDKAVNDFLYFVIAHEFGHIFDFANEVNKVTTCEEKSAENPEPKCLLHQQSWGALSWITDQKPKAENDFTNRSGLCFYWCDDNPLERDVITGLYADLYLTNFISIYATTQPWDDFADSLGYFVLMQNLKASYSIDTANGNTYNIMDKLKSSIFATKFSYLKNFLQRQDIIYP